MGKILDWMLGRPSNDTEFCKKKEHEVEAPASIIDPKRISMVKSHTIVGSIDNYGRANAIASLIDWLERNEIAIAKKTLNSENHLEDHCLALRPSLPGGCLACGPGCFGALKAADPVYVLGDTHGDFESVVAAFDTILDAAKLNGDMEPTVYLLGDILDRNTVGCLHECILILAVLQRALPEQFDRYNHIKLGIVKGDHDVALSYDEKTKKFKSGVNPADFCDWLNKRIDLNHGSEESAMLGKAWIKLMDECPAAAFLESSSALLSHGGIPRSDLQEKIKSGVPFIAQSEACAVDYEWCRMVDAKNKLLNRSSKTSEIGFQEFDSFNRDVFFGKIKKFVFAHQHPARGFLRLDKFFAGYDVICLSSFRADDTVGGPTVPYFCKIAGDEINVYSMSPAAYVVRLEENSVEKKTEEVDSSKA